ncbi:MAG: hypothetical protein CME66_03585 [Halobacteriovoraceae bacterium]|nr:hypothetical protein [Halobacteriovoraceae bacterium]
MYKLLLLTILISCSSSKSSKTTDKMPELTRNPECLEQNKMIIKEIYDDAVFAQLCPEKYKSYYDDSFDACSDGTRIFIELDPKKNNYVDHQKVTLSESKCFVNNGVLVYEDEFDGQMKQMVQNVIKQRTGEDVDLGDNIRRVRKVKIVESMVPVSKN